MRRLISLGLILVIALTLVSPAFAYGEKEHNELIESVLFGSKDHSKNMPDDEATKLMALEYATAICLDQYNGNYQDKLDYLNELKIKDIPESITDFNYTDNQYHRRYTHKGWDNNYAPNDKGNWETRKSLQIETTKYVLCTRTKTIKLLFFRFNRQYTEKKYSEQAESFAAFLYYLHILGEYHEAHTETDKTNHYSTINNNVIPLAREHPGDSNPDVFWELEKHLPVIFATQKKANSEVYKGMMADIRILASKARELSGSLQGITKENFPEYCEYAVELIEILEQRVPELLEGEPFFNEVFS